MPVSIWKPEICSFCGEVLALTWLFFQIGGSCVACNSKILCYILFENLWLAKKSKHKNQRTVSHVFLSANDILKKIWRYRTLRIQPKFAKSWKSATEESYSTCKVQQVVKVQLIWGGWLWIGGMTNSFSFTNWVGAVINWNT